MFAAACRIIAPLALAATLGVWAFAASAAGPERPLVVAKVAGGSPTRLESTYSARAGLPVRLYGYELFSAGTRGAPSGMAPVGAVPGDYVVGIGDVLQVVLRGQKSASKRYTVDREGRLVVDDLPPVPAAGRTLAELRQDLEAVVRTSLIGTDLFLSLVELRRITVLVVGEVEQPGRYPLTSLGSVLDALFAAGGVSRAGSLRRIALVHAGRAEPEPVDLYDLLKAAGGAGDLRLADGDRIVVPPLGPTVAVAGAVRRPAIYELPPDAASLSVAALERQAGGPLRPGARRVLRLAIGADGNEQPVDVHDVDYDKPLLGDGDVVVMEPLRESRVGEVRLDGHVRRPGARALAEQPSIGTLVGTDDVLPRPYLPFAVLETTDADSGARTLVPVDLAAVFELRDDRALADGDTLIVLGARDIDFLTARPVLDLLRGKPPPPRAACAGLTVLARALSAEPDGALAAGPLARAAARLAPAEGGCPPVFERHPDLLAFALSHAALVESGVPRPGYYPTASATAASQLARAAGGTPDRAARAGGGRARGGDIVETAEPWIELAGSFRHPGVRPLARARTLRAALGDGGDLAVGVYPLLGVIDRFERPGLVRRLLPFSPRDVVAGAFDRGLAERDRVVLFSAEEMRRLLEAAETAAADYARSSGLGNGPGPGRGRSESADSRSIDGQPQAARMPDRPAAEPAPRPRPTPDKSAAAPRQTLPALRDFRRAPGEERDEADAGTDAVADYSLPEPPEAAPPVKAPPAWEQDAALLTLLRDHAVAVRGAVRRPGGYPVAAPAALAAVVDAAGGLTATADPASIEVTTDSRAGPGRILVDLNGGPGAATPVGPGDAVRINPRFVAVEARGVTIEGEVLRPGSYDVLHGETLSSLLARTGGLTPEAYPAGAVFIRESARRRETEQFQRAAQDIERALATELFRPDAAARPEGVALARQLAAELRIAEGIGRITVEADPAALKARPQLDILLEPGDRLIIPKRSLTVAVAGEVQFPVVLQYDPERSADDYLAGAGGITRSADDDHIFVLLPNGSSRPLATSAWNHGETSIPPGSTVVVPRDPHPFDFLEAARNLGGVLGQLALTAASIAVISRP